MARQVVAPEKDHGVEPKRDELVEIPLEGAPGKLLRIAAFHAKRQVQYALVVGMLQRTLHDPIPVQVLTAIVRTVNQGSRFKIHG
jgi:hypothetical protein